MTINLCWFMFSTEPSICKVIVSLNEKMLHWFLKFEIYCACWKKSVSSLGKILIWREYYNEFGIYQRFHVSLLERRQKNLSNPEAYSKPCQASEIKCCAKIVNRWKLLTFFLKHYILNVWQGSEYTSLIYHILFGKIEDTNKIDSVAM